ncbi:MAG: MlaD family protein [Acidobacteriaceae bacterium]|nr:MlaD family protein [Acidobacteriaceae bacterium]
MPSQQEVKWSQLKVGVLVVVSLASLTTLLFLMTSASGMGPFSHKIIFDTYFENSNGLKKGAEVQLEGVTIGDVKSVLISQDPEHRMAPVHVIMRVSSKYQSRLHADSKATLSKTGVVGDATVDIDSRTASGPELQSGMTLSSEAGSDFGAVMSESKNTLVTLNQTLIKLSGIVDGIQHGEGTVGQLVKNRELFDNLNLTVRNLNTTVANLNAGKGSAGKLLHDDSLYNHLNDSVERLDAITASLQEGKGSAGKLLTDDQLYNNLNSTVAHLNSLLGTADQGKGTLGLLTKDEAFARKVDSTVSNLNLMLGNVNAGKGTIGKLATDDQAYTNLNDLLKNSSELVTMLRKDPKKYLTIHMKIF